MSLLMSTLPATDAENLPLWGSEDTPNAQGAEGQCVQEQLELVLRHWNERTEVVPGEIVVTEFDAELTYEPIPPKKTIHVRTRYTFRGKGKPLPHEYGPD